MPSGLAPVTAARSAEAIAWGSDSEWRPLRSVALAWPPATLGRIDDPAAWLMRGRPDLGRLRAQTAALADYYRSRGIRVLMLDAEDAPPNILFLRDTFLMTPAGAILALPKYAVRRPEIPYVRDVFARERMPVIGEIVAPGTFEGADALWLRPDLVIVGVGNRTNDEGARQLSALLALQGIATRVVPAPPRAQHLLGGLNVIGPDAAFARGCLGREARDLLRATSFRVHDIADDSDVMDRRCLNFVALDRARIVAPAMSDTSSARLAASGVVADQMEVGEYLVCDGGIACATGIIGRATTQC